MVSGLKSLCAHLFTPKCVHHTATVCDQMARPKWLLEPGQNLCVIGPSIQRSEHYLSLESGAGPGCVSGCKLIVTWGGGPKSSSFIATEQNQASLANQGRLLSPSRPGDGQGSGWMFSCDGRCACSFLWMFGGREQLDIPRP